MNQAWANGGVSRMADARRMCAETVIAMAKDDPTTLYIYAESRDIDAVARGANSFARWCRPTTVSGCSASPYRTSIARRPTPTMSCHCLAPMERPCPHGLTRGRDRGELRLIKLAYIDAP
jgi:hypothetical protein